MARKTTGRGARKRMFTDSTGSDIFKSDVSRGSPYHRQDKSTGKIKSKGKKATEDRLKPAKTSQKSSTPAKKSTPPATRSNPPASRSNVPARSNPGTEVRRGPRMMGDAQVVPKKQLPPPSRAKSIASKAPKGLSAGLAGVGAATILGSIERQNAAYAAADRNTRSTETRTSMPLPSKAKSTSSSPSKPKTSTDVRTSQFGYEGKITFGDKGSKSSSKPAVKGYEGKITFGNKGSKSSSKPAVKGYEGFVKTQKPSAGKNLGDNKTPATAKPSPSTTSSTNVGAWDDKAKNWNHSATPSKPAASKPKSDKAARAAQRRDSSLNTLLEWQKYS